MNSAFAHTNVASATSCAVMTQHFAQKCCGDVANAVMSEHLAAKCTGASFNDKIYYRYF